MHPCQPPIRLMRTGFTAIEMIVVTALMMLLLTLMLPSLQKVRDHADALRCQARLHQIGKYMGMYTDRNNGYFPQMFYETDGGTEPWESEAFTLETTARTLVAAGLDGVPLNQFVCPSDVNPGLASVVSLDGASTTEMPLSYSYNVGSNLWDLQYWKMMDITPYERWPVMFDGEYGPQISTGYLSPADFARETIVSRHPIDVAYVLYADWHVEPLLEFRYRIPPQNTVVAVVDPVIPPPPGGEDPIEEEEEVPPPPPEDEPCDFDIEDGKVCVHDDFIATVQIIGTAITYGGTYDIPVTTRIKAGGDDYQPFGPYNDALAGAVTAGATWEYQGDAGDEISLEATSWVKETRTTGRGRNRRTVTTWEEYLDAVSTGGNRVRILRDGSDVPDVQGFMGQTGVGDMVDDYVVNGKISLEPNQVIALFELGATNTRSDAFDLQDLVVLITLDPRQAE